MRDRSVTGPKKNSNISGSILYWESRSLHTVTGDRTDNPLGRWVDVWIIIRQIARVMRRADDHVLNVAMAFDRSRSESSENEGRDDAEHLGYNMVISVRVALSKDYSSSRDFIRLLRLAIRRYLPLDHTRMSAARTNDHHSKFTGPLCACL